MNPRNAPAGRHDEYLVLNRGLAIYALVNRIAAELEKRRAIAPPRIDQRMRTLLRLHEARGTESA